MVSRATRKNGKTRFEKSRAPRAKRAKAKTAAMILFEDLAAIGASVPREEWEKLPKDFNENLDHYLYGSPKKTPRR